MLVYQRVHVLFLFPGLTVMICGKIWKMVIFTSDPGEFSWFNGSKRWKFGEGPSEMRDVSIRRLVDLDPRYGPSKAEDVSLELAKYQCESAIGCPLMCARWIPIASHSHHVPQQKHGNLGG
jgi:hypothetical protein